MLILLLLLSTVWVSFLWKYAGDVGDIEILNYIKKKYSFATCWEYICSENIGELNKVEAVNQLGVYALTGVSDEVT